MSGAFKQVSREWGWVGCGLVGAGVERGGEALGFGGSVCGAGRVGWADEDSLRRLCMGVLSEGESCVCRMCALGCLL